MTKHKLHSAKKRAVFTCPHCKIPYNTKKTLVLHLKISSGTYGHPPYNNSIVEKQRTKIKCEDCNRFFKTEDGLGAHRRVKHPSVKKEDDRRVMQPHKEKVAFIEDNQEIDNQEIDQHPSDHLSRIVKNPFLRIVAKIRGSKKWPY